MYASQMSDCDNKMNKNDVLRQTTIDSMHAADDSMSLTALKAIDRSF